MKFDKQKDPTRCTGGDTRYSISGVATVTYRGRTFLASTDGRALSMIEAEPTDGDDIHDGAVYPVKAFEAARKAVHRRATECRLQLNGKAVVTTPEGTAEYAKHDQRFPEVVAVLESRNNPEAFTIAFNAKLLAELARSLATESISLTVFRDEEGRIDRLPMHVRQVLPYGTKDESFGVLMPVGGN